MKDSRQDEICRELFASAGKILKEAEVERRQSRRIFTIMILTVSAGVLAVPFYLFMNGFFASLLWKWYVVPIFNLPPISWLQATGILLLVYVFAGLLRKIPSTPEKKKDAEPKRNPLEEFNAAKESILLHLVGYFEPPIVVFIVGWIIHFFV